MSRKFKKLLLPFIILPLVTGGVTSFVVVAVVQTDSTDSVISAQFSPDAGIWAFSPANMHLPAMAFLGIAGFLLLALALLRILGELRSKIQNGILGRVRNRSPPGVLRPYEYSPVRV